MKILLLVVTLPLLATLAACSKSDQTPPADSHQSPRPLSLGEIPGAAIAKAEDAVARLEAASAGHTVLFNETMTKANTFFAERQFSEALKALAPLEDVTLSNAQQKALDDLTARLNQLLQTPPSNEALQLPSR